MTHLQHASELRVPEGHVTVIGCGATRQPAGGGRRGSGVEGVGQG